MSDINLTLPIELIVDAIVHRLDTNSRFFAKLADAIINRMVKRAEAHDQEALKWFARMRADYVSPSAMFNTAVEKWLDANNKAGYVDRVLNQRAESVVNQWALSVSGKLIREMRADVVTVLRSRLVTLSNEQLVELLKATEVKE